MKGKNKMLMMDYENTVFDLRVCDTSDLTISSVFMNAREKQPLLHVCVYS